MRGNDKNSHMLNKERERDTHTHAHTAQPDRRVVVARITPHCSCGHCATPMCSTPCHMEVPQDFYSLAGVPMEDMVRAS